MSHIILPKKWNRPEKEITPESVYNNRREFLKLMGFTAAGIAGALYSRPAFAEGLLSFLKGSLPGEKLKTDFKEIPGLTRIPEYTVNRPITKESVALKYNNFYEFTAEKSGVWTLVDRFQTRPWQVEIAGLVEHPGVYDIDDLIKPMPMEERVYRHRCVETWAMVVPWAGFPMHALIRKVQPHSKTRYVKFTSFLNPEVAPGQRNYSHAPWPYTEGLTMEEAENELTFLATGIYGHALPPQHGAPLRLVTPWKYGFKSIKSIVRIDFTETQPPTFWNTLVPQEYDFEANVNPEVAHPRWSQRREKMIGTGEIYATQKFNGYTDFVSSIYA